MNNDNNNDNSYAWKRQTVEGEKAVARLSSFCPGEGAVAEHHVTIQATDPARS